MATKDTDKTTPNAKVVYKTMRVPSDAYTLAHKLLGDVSRDGWQCIGLNRKDPPTLGALIEEGLKALRKKAA